MPKLNLGKVVGDKGDPFVFEDFTSEQLDGLTPKMLKGNVTTLDPDQNATVDIRKEGLNNYIDFGIPRGLNGSEIKSISAENVETADGNTLENAMAEVHENIAGIEEPVFDDTVGTYPSLNEYNAAAETASNAIQSHASIFSTLSNMKKSLSAIVQGLKILGENVGNIHGISSALDSQDENMAASSKAVSLLNSNLVHNNYFSQIVYAETFQPLASGKKFLYVENDVVHIHVPFYGKITAKEKTTVATLPVGCRPNEPIAGICLFTLQGGTITNTIPQIGSMAISTTGEITVYYDEGTRNTALIDILYPL